MGLKPGGGVGVFDESNVIDMSNNDKSIIFVTELTV